MLVLGAVVVVAGLVGAGALWYLGALRGDDNVADFARAPSGCATTLDFTRTGDFTVFVETAGRFDDLPGDCSADVEYDRDDVADVQFELVDPDGAEVDIAATSEIAYDTGTFVGSSVGVVTIDVAGAYVLSVDGAGAQFAVAVGGDPNDGVAALRWGAMAMAIVALVVGGLLLVVGSRGASATAESDDAPWKPEFAPAPWPIGPPGFPAPPPTTGASAPAGPPLLPRPPSPVTLPVSPSPSPAAANGDTGDAPTWGPPSISSGA